MDMGVDVELQTAEPLPLSLGYTTEAAGVPDAPPVPDWALATAAARERVARLLNCMVAGGGSVGNLWRVGQKVARKASDSVNERVRVRLNE